MDLSPLPPPPPNPNPNPNPPNPPQGRPPDPVPAEIPPDKPPHATPGNSRKGLTPEEVTDAHKLSLLEALDDVRSPFRYSPNEPFEFDSDSLGGTVSTEEFNTAYEIVVAAIGTGYHPIQGHSPLNTTNWAKLACALITLIRRGLKRPHDKGEKGELTLEAARADTPDPSPITPQYPTFFH